MISSAAKPDRQQLYIFVTSPRPDAYVNVLAHVLRTRSISAVIYISVREHGYSTEQVNDRLVSIAAGIHTHLHVLRERFKEANPSWSDTYDECLDRLDAVSVTHQIVPWVDLDKKLYEFSASGTSIFDVTSLKKNLLVDVVSLLLSRGCTRVYNFELIKTPTFDDADLIHALKASDYTYRNLGESRHVEAAQKRMLANFLTFRTLAIVTGAVTLFILLVQIFFGSTWLQTTVTVAGTATSIAGFLFLVLRNAK
jgi:hypothetical protein